MQPTNLARHAAHSRWMDRAARAGMIAKAVVFAIIGAFALMLAFGKGGDLLGAEGAARQVQRQPFGDFLLVVLGIGLACYGVWRLAQAAMGDRDPRHDGKERLALRIGRAVSGVMYLAFAVSAFQSASGQPGGGRSSWVHKVLAWDGGSWLVILAGLAVIAAGLYQLHKAYTAEFRDKLDLGRMSATERTWAVRFGRFGLAARGVVMPIIGYALIKAGMRADAGRVEGTGEALNRIASSSWGDLLLPVVAAGLIAYAAYMVVSARYTRDVMTA